MKQHLFCPVTMFFAWVAIGLPWGVDRASTASAQDEYQDFDARIELTQGVFIPPSETQLAAEAALQEELPNLAVRYERTTGALWTLNNRTGYLTDETAGDPQTIALEYVTAHLDLMGISKADLAGIELTDSVYSGVTGATHLYWRQTFGGLAEYNGQLHVSVNRDGRIMRLTNAFMPNIAGAVNTTEPIIRPGEAVMNGALHIGIQLSEPPKELGPPEGVEQRTPVDPAGISLEPIEVRLMLLPIQLGDIRLVWNFQIFTLDSRHAYDMTINAVKGDVLTRFDWVADATYEVYPVPVESPIHTTPLPPDDARQAIDDPADCVASPYGWHDTDESAGAEYTTMRGNNVHAYQDTDGDNKPPNEEDEPDCGATLDCTFPIDLTQEPDEYTAAAVANLFYWTNIIHDVQYQYGFDEAAGNFQENNYGADGRDGDYLLAEAQDSTGSNFSTPPDGCSPLMQIRIKGTSPARDGCLQNTTIVHEYAHGISSRLIGGPDCASCQGNNQLPKEGISDWFALVYTHEVGDKGTDARGIGTYLEGDPATDTGLRDEYYSTDPAINPFTYASIGASAADDRHELGAVWAQAAWEVYWALVNAHGFDPDLYNASGGSGNQRMLLYVTEGLKLAGCEPDFLNMRDGIIQAACDNYEAEDLCLIWDAFADFGLGTNALSPGEDSRNVTNGFTSIGCPDVWVEDTPYNSLSGDFFTDTGDEPDRHLEFEDMWLSRAIWVRNSVDDAGPHGDYRDHENPLFGAINEVYVTVQNRGEGTAENTIVNVYAALASTALAWEADWTFIASDTISTLAPGDTGEAKIQWAPEATGHYCLLVRLVNPKDLMTFKETIFVAVNTRYNNNIAWRNVTVQSLLSGVTERGDVIVRNTAGQEATVDLVFEEEQNFLGDGGGVTVDLGALFDLWQDGGGDAENIAVLAGTSVRLLATPARIEGFTMDEGEEQTIRVTIEAFEPMPGEGTSREYNLDVIEFIDGEKVGGVAYNVIARAQDTDTDGDGVPDVDDEDDDNDGVPDGQDANPLDPNVGVPAIPTLSEWGLVIIVLLLLVSLTIKFGRPPSVSAKPRPF